MTLIDLAQRPVIIIAASPLFVDSLTPTTGGYKWVIMVMAAAAQASSRFW